MKFNRYVAHEYNEHVCLWKNSYTESMCVTVSTSAKINNNMKKKLCVAGMEKENG